MAINIYIYTYILCNQWMACCSFANRVYTPVSPKAHSGAPLPSGPLLTSSEAPFSFLFGRSASKNGATPMNDKRAHVFRQGHRLQLGSLGSKVAVSARPRGVSFLHKSTSQLLPFLALWETGSLHLDHHKGFGPFSRVHFLTWVSNPTVRNGPSARHAIFGRKTRRGEQRPGEFGVGGRAPGLPQASQGPGAVRGSDALEI